MSRRNLNVSRPLAINLIAQSKLRRFVRVTRDSRKRLTSDLVHHVTWLFPLHLINIQLAEGSFLSPSNHSRRGVHESSLHHAMNNEKVNEDGNMKTFSHLDDDFSHFSPSLMSKALNLLKLRAKIEEEMPFVMLFALFGNLIKRCEGMAMGFNEFLVKKLF